jgi:hypothetical protein
VTAENEEGCTPAKRFDICAGFATLNRGRAQVIDTKAGFIAALNLGLIASLWAGPALTDKDAHAIVKFAGGTSTVLARVSILLALWPVLPIERLEKIVGKGSDWAPKYHPVSFYGYMARKSGLPEFDRYRGIRNGMDEVELANEALAQHFLIAHRVAAKSKWVERSGYALFLAFIAMGATLILRISA